MESKSVSKNKAAYYVLIIIFTVVFFICMAFCFVRFKNLAFDYRINSLSYRLDSIALEEKMFGSADIFSTLYFDYDYEEEFDEEWDFAYAYLAYRRGRIAEDQAPYIEELKAYLDTAPGGEREKQAAAYLEELEGLQN